MGARVVTAMVLALAPLAVVACGSSHAVSPGVGDEGEAGPAAGIDADTADADSTVPTGDDGGIAAACNDFLAASLACSTAVPVPSAVEAHDDPGSYCGTWNTCVAYGTASAACSSSLLCEANDFFCSSSGQCTDKLALGAACAADIDCADSLPCVSGTCASPQAPAGAPCMPSGSASPCETRIDVQPRDIDVRGPDRPARRRLRGQRAPLPARFVLFHGRMSDDCSRWAALPYG
jgi:hypothetical protein